MDALLFSPHPEENEVIKTILKQTGFDVRVFHNIEKAMETWPEKPGDLIIFVLNELKPGILNHIRTMRAQTAIPMTAIVDGFSEDQQVALFDAGIDLLVTKPYRIRTLQKQLQALLRLSAGVPFYSLPSLQRGEITLDPATRTVQLGQDTPVKLTQLEFRLLFTLMNHPNQLLSTEQIVTHVWGYEGASNRNLVRGLIQRLRSKIEPEPSSPRYILTDPGRGYYLAVR